MKAKIVIGIALCSILLIAGLVLAAKSDIPMIFLKDSPSEVREDIANKMSMTPQEVLFGRIEQLRQQHQEKDDKEATGDETS